VHGVDVTQQGGVLERSGSYGARFESVGMPHSKGKVDRALGNKKGSLLNHGR
jgi:hypothetical protein